ncbi:MAG: helix-turn-helix domain-containing protein [Luteolibacter sp.]|jgi:excisionase family DNA binding protein
MKAAIQFTPMLVGSPREDHQHLYTVNELADYLRVCPRQLYTWRMSGLIPYIKIGKAVRFRLADVEAALVNLTIQHETKP